MKPLTLRAHEIRRLLSAGSVTLWRPVKPQPPDWCASVSIDPQGRANWYGPEYGSWPLEISDGIPWLTCPHGAPGESRWCRETWAIETAFDSTAVMLHYAATPKAKAAGPWTFPPQPVTLIRPAQSAIGDIDGSFRSPVTMPAWASRATVSVQSVTCKMVGGVTEEEAIAAGHPNIHWFTDDWCDLYPKLIWPDAYAWGISVTLPTHRRSRPDTVRAQEE